MFKKIEREIDELYEEYLALGRPEDGEILQSHRLLLDIAKAAKRANRLPSSPSRLDKLRNALKALDEHCGNDAGNNSGWENETPDESYHDYE